MLKKILFRGHELVYEIRGTGTLSCWFMDLQKTAESGIRYYPELKININGSFRIFPEAVILLLTASLNLMTDFAEFIGVDSGK